MFLLRVVVFTQTPVETPLVVKDSIAANADAAVIQENLIHIGDLIDVYVVGNTDYDWRGSVSPEGFLDKLNFVDPPVYALCRTESETASKIAESYGKILKNPQVAVKIIDRAGRAVSIVYGAVKTPQRFQIRRPAKLNELLILAGGITENASGEVSIVRSRNLSCAPVAEAQPAVAPAGENSVSADRESDAQYLKISIADLLKGEPASNPYIFSGDVITVLEAEPIYVIGGVVNPKQISLREQLTVTRAIAAAGGFTKYADRKKATIFRREGGGTKIVDVDLEKIKSGQLADIRLQSLDVVEIDQRGSGKNKFPPIIKSFEGEAKKGTSLPLRVID